MMSLYKMIRDLGNMVDYNQALRVRLFSLFYAVNTEQEMQYVKPTISLQKGFQLVIHF